MKITITKSTFNIDTRWRKIANRLLFQIVPLTSDSNVCKLFYVRSQLLLIVFIKLFYSSFKFFRNVLKIVKNFNVLVCKICSRVRVQCSNVVKRVLFLIEITVVFITVLFVSSWCSFFVASSDWPGLVTLHFHLLISHSISSALLFLGNTSTNNDGFITDD